MTTPLNEKWRLVKDFPLYQVSNLGRVKTSLGHRNSKNYPYLNGYIDHEGYLIISIFKESGGKCHKKRVHRLVLEAFKLNPNPNKNQCNHIDGNKLNNHIDNLEWADNKENIAHARRTGLMKVRLTPTDVYRIRKLRRHGVRYRLIAKHYGLSIGYIANIVIGNNWKGA